MSEFKNMKFFVGDDLALKVTIKSVLHELGYKAHYSQTGSYGTIVTYGDGDIHFLSGDKHPNFMGEEINIDWMRSKPETVELGGKVYIKSELEEALRNIKPVGE